MPLLGGYIWLNVWARYVLLSSVSSIELWKMSRWCDIVLLFATRCLYYGVHLSWVHLSWHVKMTLHLTVNVNLTWCSTTLGHQIPLLGVHLSQVCLTVICLLHWVPENVKLTWPPDVILLLSTRCLYWWGVHLTQVCLMVICLLNCINEQKMYVDQSFFLVFHV